MDSLILNSKAIWANFRWFLALLVLINILGVIIKPFEHDELHFIYFSIHDNGVTYDSLSDFIGGLVNLFGITFINYWALKIYIVLLIVVDLILINKILQYILKDREIIRSISFVTGFILIGVIGMLANFRGFEIRPEIIGNTFFLFAFYVLISTKNQAQYTVIDVLKILAAVSCLSFAILFSLRYAPIAFAFILVLLINIFQKTKISTSIMLLLMIVCLVTIPLSSFGIIESIQNAGAIQAKRYASSIGWRLYIGESWITFTGKILTISGLLYLFFLDLRNYGHDFFFKLFSKYNFPILLVSGFYSFLFIFDVKPFGYVRSIEWLIIGSVTAWIYLSEKGEFNDRYFIKKRLIWKGIFLSFVISFFGSQYRLFTNFYSPTLISSLVNSKNKKEIKEISDADLITLMVENNSVIEQFSSRQEFCTRFPNAEFRAIRFDYHPICLAYGGMTPATFELLNKNLKNEKYCNRNDVYLSFEVNTDDEYINDDLYECYSFIQDTYPPVWIRKQ